jgi:hypothetical protein
MASLPMLHFGNPPPFSFERFLFACEGFIGEQEFGTLTRLPSFLESQGPIEHKAIQKYCAFDVALRNELVKVRAVRKHSDPFVHLREGGYFDLTLVRLAGAVSKNPSLLDAEKQIDRERWNFLEELAAGHYFDFDALVVYGFKLLILERWERIRSADKPRALNETIGV